MTVYPVVDSHTTKPIHNNSHWLDHAARLERRLELGHTLPDSAKAWLQRQPERLAFWHELLTVADVDGVANVTTLQAWQYFGTKRRQRYLLANLEQYRVLERLEHGKVKVIA